MQGKQIRDQRMRSGIRARLPGGDTDSGQQQMSEAAGSSACRRHDAEYTNGADDEMHAVGSIGPARQRNPQHGIEDCERKPVKKPGLGVGQVQIVADRLDENGQDLPVHVVHRENGDQHDQRAATQHRSRARRQRGREPETDQADERLNVDRHTSATVFYNGGIQVGDQQHERDRDRRDDREAGHGWLPDRLRLPRAE